MPRMIVLNAAERQIYETPPILDVSQRVRAFDVPAGLLGMAKALRKPAHQIGFLVSCAYFGIAKRFFAPKDYHARDIRHAAGRLDLPAAFTAADYPVRILYGQWIHVPLRRWNRAPKKGACGNILRSTSRYGLSTLHKSRGSQSRCHSRLRDQLDRRKRRTPDAISLRRCRSACVLPIDPLPQAASFMARARSIRPARSRSPSAHGVLRQDPVGERSRPGSASFVAIFRIRTLARSAAGHR